MNKLRFIRWVALVAGIFLVPFLALIVLLPMIVDSQSVKATAIAFIAEKTDGLARFEKIDLFWFPRPSVLIRMQYFLPTADQGKIQQLRLYPSLRDLLTNLTFRPCGPNRLDRPATGAQCGPFDLDAVSKILSAVKALRPLFRNEFAHTPRSRQIFNRRRAVTHDYRHRCEPRRRPGPIGFHSLCPFEYRRANPFHGQDSDE
jgi:hypothetical protein